MSVSALWGSSVLMGRGGHPGKKGLRSGPGRVHGFDPRVRVGSGSGPGRVRSTETRQPKAMGVDPGSPFNLNIQKGEKLTK